MPRWPDIADQLPAPRDDEPSSLRQDIADELADHLTTALHRELHFTRDETAATAKTLDRFGDPRKIARKLWLEAMQEKIMSQRMTFVVLLVVAIASLGSTGLMWFVVDQVRQVNQAMLEQHRDASAALLAETRQVNTQLIERLAALTGRPERSMEWNPLKVRLLFEKIGGIPAKDCEVVLSGHILDTGKNAELSRNTGPEGDADFGKVRPGHHHLAIKTPWGESTIVPAVVLPGEPRTIEAVIPSPLEEVEISLSVNWPDDLARRGLWLVSDFHRPARNFDNQTWTRDVDRGIQYGAINPSGGIINFDGAVLQATGNRLRGGVQRMGLAPDDFFLPNTNTFRVDRLGIYRFQLQEGLAVPSVHDDMYIGLPAIEPFPVVRWPVGKYEIKHVAIGQEPSIRDDRTTDALVTPRFLASIVLTGTGDGKANWKMFDRLPLSNTQRQQGITFQSENTNDSDRIATPLFEAYAGRRNYWRIELSPPLVERLRQSLAEHTAEK